MLKRTETVNGVITIGEEELRNILAKYLYSYRFHFGGNNPTEIIIPMFSTVGGVDISYEPAIDQDPPEKGDVKKEVESASPS